MLDFDIALGDWGVASWTHCHLTELIQPVSLHAPEVLIGAAWGPETDLWNLSSVVVEVFRAIRRFTGRRSSSAPYELHEHIRQIVHQFGPFPRRLLDRGDPDVVRAIFDAEGRVRDAPPLQAPPLDSDVFMTDLTAEHRASFVAFLRALMRGDPEEPKETMELVAEPWLDAIRRD
jgi:serine/threonine-protein kinase SRPK3